MQPFNIHILGCGSAMPTQRHQPSAQVVECRGKFFLVDCGEGTQLQIRRARLHFGKIDHVFISHLHGDHCMGLIGMICSFGLLGRKAPLHIFAPEGLEDLTRRQVTLFCHDLGYELRFTAIDTRQAAVIYEDRSLTVETIPLDHRLPCAGFLFREKATLPHICREKMDLYDIPSSQAPLIKAGQGYTTPDGRQLSHEELTIPAAPPRSYAYMSDTRYKPDAAAQIKGVDLLYHESTYADGEADQAIKYFHSTARQAAAIARDAGAGRLLLGHFSSRYDDETILLDEALQVFPNSHLARELDIIKI